jgi:hypothetical protein
MFKMGTNYYMACEHCNSELKHIGKQSVGWNFRSNFSIEEVKAECKLVVDEYGRKWTVDEFFSRVTPEWDIHPEDKNTGWC